MGASCWMTIVPYEDDFGDALWQARRQVFQNGDYQPPYGMTREEAGRLSDEDIQAATAEFFGIGPDELADLNDRAPEGLEPPAPRDDLDKQIIRMLNMTMDAGSHSILDIWRVDREAGFGVVVPLAEAETLQIFGTLTPSRSQVEQAQQELWDRCPRWQGVLVVAYDAAKPSEICFLGASGD